MSDEEVVIPDLDKYDVSAHVFGSDEEKIHPIMQVEEVHPRVTVLEGNPNLALLVTGYGPEGRGVEMTLLIDSSKVAAQFLGSSIEMVMDHEGIKAVFDMLSEQTSRMVETSAIPMMHEQYKDVLGGIISHENTTEEF